MRYLHHHGVMIPQLRSFLVVIEEGSLHLAATRLNLSQSALSRQMQALEYEFGGKLLERSSTGVRPTIGGHALSATVGALLGNYDSVMLEVRRLARGQSEEIRIGYLGSAFEEYLEPALKKLHKVHPRTKVKLLDLFPGEQITALRKGEIDTLCWHQIDFERGVIRVEHTDTASLKARIHAGKFRLMSALLNCLEAFARAPVEHL